MYEDYDDLIEDVSKAIHSDYYKNFKYAKVWGSSNYPGEKVGLKYPLQDRDNIGSSLVLLNQYLCL